MPTALENIIKDEIRQKGPMNLARYMALCLGHAEHGYYMTRDPFGAQGDFTTAPEISQMFGEMIGAWVADTWMKMGMPSKFILLECGPGRGTLMMDVMRATKNVENFHNAVQLHLMETSPVLKEIQKKNLTQYGPSWHDGLSTLPQDCPVILIGNEFLDALPVRQLTFDGTDWYEKFVDLDINDTLRLCEKEADNEVKSALPAFLIPPKAGEQVEVSLHQKSFLNDAMNIVLKQGGIILFVDYGFIHNVAGDTLQAVKNHQYCDIFETPGEADITAHVNFAEISSVAMSKNMTVHGPVSQGEWLKRLGITIRADQLIQNATEKQRRDIGSALDRLVGVEKNMKDGRGQMGALFKVIAFSSNSNIQLAGLSE